MNKEYNKKMNRLGLLKLKKLITGDKFDEVSEKKKLVKQYQKMNQKGVEKEIEKRERVEAKRKDQFGLDLEIEDSFMGQVPKEATCKWQILRSTSEWSTGVGEVEKSIQEAYIKLIEESQHHIYIENQFFVSNPGRDDWIVENRIWEALKVSLQILPI